MQKTRRLTKCATACGSCPRSRSAWATDAKDAATLPGFSWPQRRVLECQGVLTELVECSVEVGPLALVFPGEVVALPDVVPPVAAGVPARSSLEAVRVPRWVSLGRRRLAQQAAQVDEVLLGRRALLQLGVPPLCDELVRRHDQIFVKLPVSGGLLSTCLLVVLYT